MITLNKEDAFTIVDIISKAQEIVRCKDCKWFNTTYYKDTQICERHAYEIIMKPDDFCSRGERKDE